MIPDAKRVEKEILRNKVEARLLRQQYRAAKEVEGLRQPGDEVESQHILPIGMTGSGKQIVVVVPPELTKYDRQRLLDAKHAKDFARIVELCEELGAQLATAEVV